jgi:galactan endo-1,6-beta-galactosidase
MSEPRANVKSVAFILALAIVQGVGADLTTTIDAKSNFGTWEGWGTSLAWWVQAFGTRDDLADIFFTTKTVSLNAF